MSDDVARAVGSEGVGAVVIDGKPCTVRPLTLAELGTLERVCLKHFQRSYLQTFSENLDLLPEADATKLMAEKMEVVAKWDVQSLPVKTVYDPKKINLSNALRSWVVAFYDVEPNSPDQVLRNLATTALDSGELKEEKYIELAGSKPRKASVGYVNWWITGCFEGMIEMIYLAFRGNGVSKEQLMSAIGKDMSTMIQLAREIEGLTAPKSGNT